MSIIEELNNITNDEGTAKEKASKILNLNFTEEDVDKITEAIVQLYQDSFNEIDLDDNDIDDIRENIAEISYRNSYLLNDSNNDSKKDNAIEQKQSFIRKIEKALRIETKGLKENEEIEGYDDMKKDNNRIDDFFQKEEENETYPIAIDEEGNVVDLDPAYNYQPRVNKDGTLTMIRVDSDKKEEKQTLDHALDFFDDPKPNKQDSKKDRIERIKNKYKALEEAEIKRIDLEERKDNLEKEYEDKKADMLKKLEEEKNDKLNSIEKQIQDITNEILSISNGTRVL